ncbi:hypothetical protein SUGI_0319690 [Cryptomeria japonica]|nr:hypothetical protein SUGI_0319690 [Cryptomeria japonica]
MERLWNLTKTSDYKLRDKKQIIDSTVWSPPKTRIIKVNFDGADRGNLGKSIYGAIIRDKFGNFVGANYGPLGINTNNMAEMAGLVAGMECLNSFTFKHIYREGNSVADWLANRGVDCNGPKKTSKKEDLPEGLLSVLEADKAGIPRTGIG